ncbi:hypothetical protein L6452_32974 [Arctium lappa]|uniref:Uncharacterized protein n=1 Tax=Arctium lappa TaxID=4217 RepID=A0ACB8Z7A4_ARCLA|nr:hypothetical protein L6452_32974 [Arctium lappa]
MEKQRKKSSRIPVGGRRWDFGGGRRGDHREEGREQRGMSPVGGRRGDNRGEGRSPRGRSTVGGRRGDDRERGGRRVGFRRWEGAPEETQRERGGSTEERA